MRRFRSAGAAVPALEKTLTEASPLVDALHTFFPELNPILSYLNFHQTTVAAFITNGGADLAATTAQASAARPRSGIIEDRSFNAVQVRRRSAELGARQRLPAPNSLMRALKLGTIESFKCPGGVRKYAEDALAVGQKAEDKRAALLRGAAVALRRAASSRS